MQPVVPTPADRVVRRYIGGAVEDRRARKLGVPSAKRLMHYNGSSTMKLFIPFALWAWMVPWCMAAMLSAIGSPSP